MNLNPNLKFDEIMVRYMVLMAIGITAGALQNFWLIAPAMLVFLTAILGWDPVKAYLQYRREHKPSHKKIVLTHRHAA